MRSLAVLALAAMLSLGCDGSDISDNPPVNSGTVDASADGPQNGDDAGGDDAGGDPAQAFCNQYEMDCGYAQGPNRFDNEQACLDAYNGFDAARRTCVETALDNGDCQDATGLGGCAN